TRGAGCRTGRRTGCGSATAASPWTWPPAARWSSPCRAGRDAGGGGPNRARPHAEGGPQRRAEDAADLGRGQPGDRPDRIQITREDQTAEHPDRAFVVRLATGELRAFVNRCRHANLPLDWGDERFLDEAGKIACRAHGARFEPEDGRCFEGPCWGKQLRPVKVELEGELIVATAVAQPIARGS